jgi:quercetin dioxygenase-like cupin family protein
MKSLLLGVLLVSVTAFAQSPAQPPAAPPIKRTLLQKIDLGDKEKIMAIAEIAPGAAAGRHFHAGVETGYVLEGEATMEIEGEAPRVVKAGDSFTIPAGKAHDAATRGDKPVKVLAVYVVEKGKPLATPAPK